MNRTDIECLIDACQGKEQDAKARMDAAIAAHNVDTAYVTRGEWLAWRILGGYVHAILHPSPLSEQDFARRLVKWRTKIEEHEKLQFLPDEPGRKRDRILAKQSVAQSILERLRNAEDGAITDSQPKNNQ